MQLDRPVSKIRGPAGYACIIAGVAGCLVFWVISIPAYIDTLGREPRYYLASRQLPFGSAAYALGSSVALGEIFAAICFALVFLVAWPIGAMIMRLQRGATARPDS